MRAIAPLAAPIVGKAVGVNRNNECVAMAQPDAFVSSSMAVTLYHLFDFRRVRDRASTNADIVPAEKKSTLLKRSCARFIALYVKISGAIAIVASWRGKRRPACPGRGRQRILSPTQWLRFDDCNTHDNCSPRRACFLTAVRRVHA